MTSLRRLHRGVSIALLVLLLLATVVVSNAALVYREAESVAAEARRIMRNSASLIALAAEADLNARVRVQWDEIWQAVNRSTNALSKLEGSAYPAKLLGLQLQAADQIFRLRFAAVGPARHVLDNSMTTTIQGLGGVAQNLLQEATARRNAGLRELLVVFALSVLLIALALLGAAYLLRCYVTRPLAVLAEAIRVGGGDPAARVPMVSTDEIQTVAAALNERAATLQRTLVSRDALQAEVRERARAEAETRAALDEVKQAQQRLVQMEKLSALGTLVGGVAHEINNPLMGITSYLSFAIDRVDEGKPRQMLQRASLEVERIGRIVKNMLVFARARPPQRDDRSDLARIVAETLELIGPDLARHHVSVRLEGIDQALVVPCAEDALRQVLINLPLNARDALAAVGHEGAITISAERRTDGATCLVVADNGPGVPEELKTKIFDPFFTTKPAGQGTGLGLAVALQMIEASGGRLSVADSPGGGAAFQLLFDKTL